MITIQHKKNTKFKKRNIDHWSIFFLSFAILLGGYARLWQVLPSTFPLNDGGMFYQMTKEIIQNHYKLPFFTHYNGLEIPFVYPPLPFFLIGFFSHIFRIDLLDAFRIFPAIISTFSIPAMFFLTKEITGNKTITALSTIVFSLMPASFNWLIMGGGISRSLGFVFSLLTIQQTWKLYKKKRYKYVINVAILSSLTVLSHPEAIIHTIAGVVVLFLFWGRSRKGILFSGLVLSLVILFTSPWWLINLERHGLAPFLAAGRTGWHQLDAIFKLWVFNFSDEINLRITGVLALIGLFLLLAKREYFLPLWLIVTYFLEPRSAPLYITPILAMLAAYTINELFLIFNNLENPTKNKSYTSWAENLFQGKTVKVVFTLFLSYWVFSAYAIPVYILRNTTLGRNDLTTFRWIEENIPAGSRFAVLTRFKPLTDPVSEWFPALTGMVSVNTPQGLEWIGNVDFNHFLLSSMELQNCFEQQRECLETWQRKNNVEFEYIYVRKTSKKRSGEEYAIQSPLEMSLIASNSYHLIYDNTFVSILQRNH